MSGSPVSFVWSYLAAFPPIKCRLLAHDGNMHTPRALTNAEVAIAGGFTLPRVIELSQLPDWDTVAMGEMRRFFTACNFNPLSSKDRARVWDYESKCIQRQSRPFQWLTRSPAYQTEFLPLIRLLSQSAPSPAQHVA